jgi:hypothetical protein
MADRQNRLKLTLAGALKAQKGSTGDTAAHASDASPQQSAFAHWSIETLQNSSTHRQVSPPAKQFVPVHVSTWTGTWHR